MAIYLLKESDEGAWEKWAEANDTFYSPYQDIRGMVVRADSENVARQIAVEREGPYGSAGRWLDATVTVCERVEEDGSPMVVLANIPTG